MPKIYELTELTDPALGDQLVVNDVSVPVSGQAKWMDLETLQGLIGGSTTGFTPGGRLTTTSGTPVPVTDVNNAASIWYVPHVHDVIQLWDGSQWAAKRFDHLSVSFASNSSGVNYDVFCWLSGTTPALSRTAWTNDTTRASGITVYEGRPCMTNNRAMLLLGTVRASSTSGTHFTEKQRFVSNVYNTVHLTMANTPAYNDNNTSNSYTHSSTSWSAVNADVDAKIEFVTTLDGTTANGIVRGVGDGAGTLMFAIGVDSTTTAYAAGGTNVSTVMRGTYTAAIRPFTAGYHYFSLLAAMGGGTGSIIVDLVRTGGTTDPRATYIHGFLEG